MHHKYEMANEPQLRRAAVVLKALGHPDRLRMVAALAAREAGVCHLVVLLGLRQPTVSQHLAVLRRAGLVRGRREGLYVYYRVVSPLVRRLLDRLHIPPAPGPDRLAGCPCPGCSQTAAVGKRRWRRPLAARQGSLHPGALL